MLNEIWIVALSSTSNDVNGTSVISGSYVVNNFLTDIGIVGVYDSPERAETAFSLAKKTNPDAAIWKADMSCFVKVVSS